MVAECHCAVTALVSVTRDGNHYQYTSANALGEKIATYLGIELGSVSTWNDAQPSARPVIKAFRDCAKSLEA